MSATPSPAPLSTPLSARPGADPVLEAAAEAHPLDVAAPLALPVAMRPTGWVHGLAARVAGHTAHWSATHRALVWAAVAGGFFSVLNALMRALTQHLDPFQAQFLRYLFGALVLLPVILTRGLAHYRPSRLGPHFTRGALHTLGLCFWFTALPRIPLADMTAIGFTTPLFIMLGAWLLFKEPMRWERWAATVVGFGGVLIVVGPRLSGEGSLHHLLMLASAPVFAASFLLTKAMTRYESAGTILVWQAVTVSLLSLPLALWHWAPLGAWQWLGFALSGLLGSAGHYCITRGFAAADISATQSVKFLDLVWSVILGWLVFADLPSASTALGGSLICAATLWVARRESAPRAR